MPVDSGVSGSSDDPPSSSRSSEVAETRSPPTESVGSVREPTPAKPASAPARALAVRDGESFLREARLSGGTTLRLTGIVWSDASPAALINGEVYSVGEGDGAWSVAEVQRGEVTIESDGLRFSLRLK